MLSGNQNHRLFSKSIQGVISVEAIHPDDVLADKGLLEELIELVTKAFTFHNPGINQAYESSNNKEEFLALSRDQMIDSVQQIAKANQVRENDGIIMLARDASKVNKPIVGIVSGVRNGHPHPSHEYMDKLFKSECGLGAAIGSAFGSVLSKFNMQKMDEYKNVFMLGLIAVSQDSMRHGVATKLSQALHAKLAACQYDGLFSIITSPKAEGLLNKLISQILIDQTHTYMKLEDSENSMFFGIALNSKGVDTFNSFNSECRQREGFKHV